jgi:hypothetical protein
MAPTDRTMRASRARAELVLVRAIGAAALAFVGYAGATTAAIGPAFGLLSEVPGAPVAALVRSGADLTITGSVDHIFASAGFTGPNRAEKRDRLVPVPDVMTVASVFDNIRARIASLRHPGAPLPAPDQSVAASTAETVFVASLDPEVSSEALSAIDDAALGGAPLPVLQSEQLSYARAEVPKTIFDGVVRDKHGNKVSEKELNCLAQAIYFEARGEAYRGQVAVGQVVLNRVQHRLYPATICGVVFQNQHKRNACQFSFACDGIPERVTEKKAWAQAEEIAKGVVSGQLYLTEVGYATHYHATYVYPHWAPRMKKVTKIGMHVFYHFKRGWKFG